MSASFKAKEIFHSSVKPYRFDQLAPFVSEDSLYQYRTLRGDNFIERTWNYIGFGHVVTLETEDFDLSIDPLIDWQLGRDYDAFQNLYTNTRGAAIRGRVGKDFGFAATFRENQTRHPEYIQDFIFENQVVPGQGRVRRFKVGGVDYANATGYISWSPSRFVNFQMGHGQHFIGDGYRSMLLSDNAYPYPFFKIESQVWKFKYTNIWTQFQDLQNGSNFVTGFQRKYGSFHYLSYAVTEWLQIGLFEAVIWQGSNDTLQRGFDFNYINPLIFYRPVEFGLGSPDNTMMGANLKIQPLHNLAIYGQFFLDDLDIARSREGEGFYRNKMGFQAGVKWFAPFELENLILRAEYNRAKPFTYAHKVPTQNYAHYNQPLAHPLGANFDEFIGIASYRWKRIYGDLKLQLASYGEDSIGSHFGKDIFISDFEIENFPESYGNFTGQGVNTNLFGLEFRAGYIISPAVRWSLEASVSYRNLAREGFSDRQLVWLQFGMRTNIFNRYYDF